MLALISAGLFAGWTLVYAAVADGGRFATTPWEALRRDAYAGADGSSGASGAPAHHSSTFDRIVNGITSLVPLPFPIPKLP